MSITHDDGPNLLDPIERMKVLIETKEKLEKALIGGMKEDGKIDDITDMLIEATLAVHTCLELFMADLIGAAEAMAGEAAA